jgi:hypothetical protein
VVRELFCEYHALGLERFQQVLGVLDRGSHRVVRLVKELLDKLVLAWPVEVSLLGSEVGHPSWPAHAISPQTMRSDPTVLGPKGPADLLVTTKRQKTKFRSID